MARVFIACALTLTIFAEPVGALRDAHAQNGIVGQWSGRVPRPVASGAPIREFITNAADFTALWQECRIKGEAPSIDFGKYLVLVSTARSSVLKVRAVQIDEKGDLKTVVAATPDMTQDYAIVITQVERVGVWTVHGQSINR